MGQYCTPEHVTGGAAVGDYDGDGLEDVFFTVFHDRSVLYKNNGEFCLTAFYNDLLCLLLYIITGNTNEHDNDYKEALKKFQESELLSSAIQVPCPTNRPVKLFLRIKGFGWWVDIGYIFWYLLFECFVAQVSSFLLLLPVAPC